VRPIPDLLHSSIHNRPGTKTAIMKHRGKYQNFDRSRTLDSAPTHCHPERSMISQFFLEIMRSRGTLYFCRVPINYQTPPMRILSSDQP
jgi:hypothetical protein